MLARFCSPKLLSIESLNLQSGAASIMNHAEHAHVAKTAHTAAAIEAASHRDYLYRFAMKKVRDADLADDLVQDTLLAALQSGTAYAGRSTYRVWLTGILKHKISDAWRASGRTVSITGDDDDQTCDFDALAGRRSESAHDSAQSLSADPQHLLSLHQLLGKVDSVIAGLPKAVAEVFMAREIEGESTSDLSQRLGVSEENIWVRVHRAKKALRACLGDGNYAMA